MLKAWPLLFLLGWGCTPNMVTQEKCYETCGRLTAEFLFEICPQETEDWINELKGRTST